MPVADAKEEKMEPCDEYEDALRIRYESCHPDDSFEALKLRAAFSKEDRRLLEDWRAAARAGALDRH